MFGKLFLNERIFPHIQGTLGKFFLGGKISSRYTVWKNPQKKEFLLRLR
jgi:hypothetical protein